MTKHSPEPVSMLGQAVDSLQSIDDRLKMAHVYVRRGDWKEPIAEPEAVLLQASEKISKFRRGLLRFARQSGIPVAPTRSYEDF